VTRKGGKKSKKGIFRGDGTEKRDGAGCGRDTTKNNPLSSVGKIMLRGGAVE